MAKAILKGHLCDTETAKEIGSCDNGFDPTNFNYVEQTLYINKAGYYFLSTYHMVWAGNNGKMKTTLELLEDKEADNWAQHNLNADDYIVAFGTPREILRLSITVSSETRKKLEKLKEKRKQTFNEIISDLINSAE